MNKNIQPSAFYTFDPTKLDIEAVIKPIEMSFKGEHEELIALVSNIKSFPKLQKSKAPKMDKATILFISVIDWQSDGGAPIPLDKNNIKERIGRFPTSDGNAIKYLLTYTSQEDHESRLHELLYKLMNGLSEEDFGLKGYDKGIAGLEMMGWLNYAEVGELKLIIQKGKWIVSADEPFDGGIQEIFKNLVKLLKSAERRECGILMRKHS
jgi:hypothetical protein|tara:strand:+ start:1020 stop:1646 length:627 start_codon:yes stop_codon:yes gene_type:complete